MFSSAISKPENRGLCSSSGTPGSPSPPLWQAAGRLARAATPASARARDVRRGGVLVLFFGAFFILGWLTEVGAETPRGQLKKANQQRTGTKMSRPGPLVAPTL